MTKAISGSTRGWPSEAATSGSPISSRMASVRKPWTGAAAHLCLLGPAGQSQLGAHQAGALLQVAPAEGELDLEALLQGEVGMVVGQAGHQGAVQVGLVQVLGQRLDVHIHLVDGLMTGPPAAAACRESSTATSMIMSS